MQVEEITECVVQCINDMLEDTQSENEASSPEPISVNASTKLIGKDAVLDSIGLVSIIADMEEMIEDNYGYTIAIADERAMSREKSPFLTVTSLAEYILELVRENG